MNKILLFFTIIFLASCSKEVIESVNLDHIENQEISDELKLFRGQALLRKGTTKSIYISSTNIATENRKPHPDFSLAWNTTRRQYPNAEDWKAVHEQIQQRFAMINGKEAEYTVEIQGQSLRVLDQYLLKVEMAEEVSIAAQYYMDLLMYHQAVDWDVMADATTALDGWVAPEKIKLYKEYILTEAAKDIELKNQLIDKAAKTYNDSMNKADETFLRGTIQFYVNGILSANYAIDKLAISH